MCFVHTSCSDSEHMGCFVLVIALVLKRKGIFVYPLTISSSVRLCWRLLTSSGCRKARPASAVECRIQGISGSAFLPLAKRPVASLLSLSSRQFYLPVIVFPDEDPEGHKGGICPLSCQPT
jgi:hypothetical protein